MKSPHVSSWAEGNLGASRFYIVSRHELQDGVTAAQTPDSSSLPKVLSSEPKSRESPVLDRHQNGPLRLCLLADLLRGGISEHLSVVINQFSSSELTKAITRVSKLLMAQRCWALDFNFS